MAVESSFDRDLMLLFGVYGGGYAMAFVFLLLASFAHGWPRIIFCFASWVATLMQSWWWIMLVGLSFDVPENMSRAFEWRIFSGIVLALAITIAWGYFLFRESKPKVEVLV